jgi:thioredoxin-related protein
MSRFLLAALLFLSCGFFAFAQDKDKKKEEKSEKKGELVWYTDINKAQELSTKSKKPIFAFFTGSDWCGWCHRLQANVFAKTEFVDWAKKNVILLELDFPRNKQLTPELAEQNQGLQQAFQVRGYPTIWIFYMKQEGKEKKFSISALGSLGYPQGAEPGKEQLKFLTDANNVLKNKS